MPLRRYADYYVMHAVVPMWIIVMLTTCPGHRTNRILFLKDLR